MITLWTRLNAVFFYATTVLVFLGLGTAVTALWLPSKPVVSQLRISKLITLRPQQESIRRPDLQDRAIFTFDLDAGACAKHSAPLLPPPPPPPLTQLPRLHGFLPTPLPRTLAPRPQTFRPCSTGTSSSCLFT